MPPLFTVTPKQTGSLPGDSLDVTWAEPLRDQSAYFHLIQFEAIITRGAKARFAKWGGSDTLILSIGAQVPISYLQTGILISILLPFEVLKAVSFNEKCIISYSLLHESKAWKARRRNGSGFLPVLISHSLSLEWLFTSFLTLSTWGI